MLSVTATIPLRRRDGTYLSALVDEDVLDRTVELHGRETTIRQLRWCAAWDPSARTFYVLHSERVSGRHRTTYLHRLVLGTPGKVDHRNRNGLDNRLENLRPASDSQNMANSRKPDGRSSQYKGVNRAHFSKRRGCYMGRAQIRVEGQLSHLGVFESEILAACAYDRAARAFFGEFAACNFKEVIG